MRAAVDVGWCTSERESTHRGREGGDEGPDVEGSVVSHSALTGFQTASVRIRVASDGSPSRGSGGPGRGGWG